MCAPQRAGRGGPRRPARAWPASLLLAMVACSAPAAGPDLPLRDIQMPPPPGWWPPAPGWWLLAALLMAGLGWLGWLGLQADRRRRRRTRLLAELDRLVATADSSEALVVAVAGLLKRVALTRWPRAEVAALTGADWLAWLDRTGGDGGFSQGPGRVLAEGPYAPGAPGLDRPALLALVRRWLARNAG